MLPGMELMECKDLAVPAEVMHHIVRVESSYNPYAIGVVGGRLVRQPNSLPEAVATARMLESRGYNFSLGLAQVNRYNLGKYGLETYEEAFDACPNLTAGSRILAECHSRSGRDWGKSFSCYYSGNFVTGYRHGYVQKVYASMRTAAASSVDTGPPAIEVIGRPSSRSARPSRQIGSRQQLAMRRTSAATPAPLLAARRMQPPQVSGKDDMQAVSMPMPTTAPIPQHQGAASDAALIAEPGEAQIADATAMQAADESILDKAFVF